MRVCVCLLPSARDRLLAVLVLVLVSAQSLSYND